MVVFIYSCSALLLVFFVGKTKQLVKNLLQQKKHLNNFTLWGYMLYFVSESFPSSSGVNIVAIRAFIFFHWWRRHRTTEFESNNKFIKLK